MRTVLAAIVLMTAWAASPPSYGWTPEYCLTASDISAGSPCLTIGPDSRMHCIYVADFGGGPLLYYGVWQGTYWSTAQQLPSPGYKTAGAQMDIDPDNHIHVVAIYRVDGTMNTPYTVYYWEYDGSTWSGPTQLSDGRGGDSDNCSVPRIGADGFGNLHVVWQEGNRTGGKADLMYRRRVGDAWQTAINLTNNGAPGGYGSCSPDMCVERDGTAIHLVWHDGFSGRDLLYYTRSTDLGNTWPPSNQWVRLSGEQYGKGASMALDRLNNPNVWWTDTDGSGNKFPAYRRWNGSAWTPIGNWGERMCLGAAFDGANLMQTVYQSNSELYYCTYDFAGFSPGELVSGGANTWKADAASIVVDSANHQSVLWEERKGEWPGVSYIFFSTAMPLPAPAPVSSFAATPSDSLVRLRWTNPPSVHFAGTIIRCKTTGFPTGPMDGTLVCERPAAPGSTDSFEHTSLTNGTTYYYVAFTHDGSGQYNSEGPHPIATPYSTGIAHVKRLADNTTVDLREKVVTAVFGSDGAIYVEEANCACGVRVVTSEAGLAVGDVVDLSGRMGTRILSGYPAERQVIAASVSQAETPPANTPLRPMGMTCGAVGGAGSDLVPGVRGGSGANNMGLLVKVAGRITRTITSYLYIDDGTGIPDTSGYASVMVKCPGDPTQAPMSLRVGDVVAVTGIVEGSIPTGAGWTANRRYIHTRDWNDIALVQRR